MKEKEMSIMSSLINPTYIIIFYAITFYSQQNSNSNYYTEEYVGSTIENYSENESPPLPET